MELKKVNTFEFLRNRYSGLRPSALSKVKVTKPSTLLIKMAKPAFKSTKQIEPVNIPKGNFIAPVSIIQFSEPLSDPELNNPIYINTFHIKRKDDLQLDETKSLSEVCEDDRCILFYEKSRLCQNICDFSSPDKDLKAKEIKTQCLNDMVAIFSGSLENPKNYFYDLGELLNLIEKNISRPEPHIHPSILAGNFTFCDTAWTHLYPIYQIFYNLVICYQSNLQISLSFIKMLLSLLNFPDERERDQIVKILLEYLRFHPEQVSFVLKCVSDNLIYYSEFKTESFSISSSLMIIYSYINQAIPFLKPFQSVMAPLLSCKGINSFFSLLLSIIDNIITYDKTQTTIVMKEMITRFPISPISSQVIRLSMINKLIERLDISQFSEIYIHFFHLYAKCINSRATKVVLTAFHVFSNKHAQKLFSSFTHHLFSIIYPAVSYAMLNHWSQRIKGPALIVLKTLQNISPKDFEKMHNKKIEASEISHPDWNRITEIAVQKYKNINEKEMKAKAQEYFANVNRIAKLEMEPILCQPQKIVEPCLF